MQRTVLRTTLLLTLAACAAASPTPPDTPPTPTPPVPPPASTAPSLARTVVLSGLASPWDLALLADGSIFFTEKCRGLSLRRTTGTTVRLFGTSGSALVAPDFFCDGQSGMHGVALDPDFANNRRIYLYMPSDIATRANRVVRLELGADLTTVTARTDIVTGIALKLAATPNGGAGSHSGGRIRFGPDGFLYIGTGDNHNGSLPQSPTLLGGKVLRVTTSGAAAPGNNAPSGFDARIFTYGHRNVQGIAFRPGTGQPFSAEHGPGHTDEVTPLVAGGNGGWDPQNRSGLSCPDNYCGYQGNATSMPMTDRTRFPNAMLPSWINVGESRGTGPATFLSGTQWQGWNGRLIVGVMGGNRADLLTLDSAGIATAITPVPLPGARMRSLVQGPDGNLWVATDSGEIWRVVPS